MSVGRFRFARGRRVKNTRRPAANLTSEVTLMFPYLRIFLIHLWVACTAGAVLIAGLSMGLVSVQTFIWAGVIGLVVGVPAGLLNWAYLRPNRSRALGRDTGPVAWINNDAALAQGRLKRHPCLDNRAVGSSDQVSGHEDSGRRRGKAGRMVTPQECPLSRPFCSATRMIALAHWRHLSCAGFRAYRTIAIGAHIGFNGPEKRVRVRARSCVIART